MEPAQPSTGDPLRVVIVDPDDRIRESLAGILHVTHQVEVVGTAAGPDAAELLVARLRPDIVILDPRLPDVDAAVAFVDRIRASAPDLCVLALNGSEPLDHPGLAACTDGQARKTYRSTELLAAVVAATARRRS